MASGTRSAAEYAAARGGSRARRAELAVPVRPAVLWAKRLSGLAALALGLWLLVEDRRAADGAGASGLAVPQDFKPRVLATAASAGGHCNSSHAHASHSLESTLCFLVTCCLVCAALDHWNALLPAHCRLPISVVIFMCGMAIGVVVLKALDASEAASETADVFIAGFYGASNFDPHAIFYVLLPPLLFESASSMSWHVLRKVLPSAVLLAVPGVVLNTLLVGAFARLTFHVEGVGAMNWEASLLLASILSATDPVAVVAALHSLGAPKKLATLIEGESLLNDGSAVVFFGVFLDMVATGAPDETKQCPGLPPSGGCVVLYFLRLAFGGPALGVAIGLALYAWISWARARESPLLEISLVMTAVYGGFFLAECLHVSGVLAVVTLGILVTAGVFTRMSHEGRHALHQVLAQISYACNHIIFFSAGIISARFMWNATECVALYRNPRAWLELFLLYVCLHVMRALVIAAFSPMLTRLGYGITWKEGAVLVWGGLRGAVGLAMGLLVEHQSHVDERVSATVAFHVSGIVLLTLIVNGMTVDNVYRRLQPYPPNPFNMTYLRKSLRILEDECGRAILERMLDDWFFQDIDFESILACVPNFAKIEFNEARMPYPDGIKTVKETLQSLEAGATRFKHDLLARQKETWIKTYGERQSSWDHLKDAESSQLLPNLWEVASPRTGRDHVANVANTGDQRFEYKARDDTSSPGLYVSARPLSLLSSSNSAGQHTFSVKVLCMESAHVVVGLVAMAPGCTDKPMARAPSDGEVKLGAAPNSVGLDLFSGKLRVNGPAATSEEEQESFGPMPTGSTVHITVMREVGQEWQVRFASGDFDCRLLAKCTLGPFAPDQLYPTIQFCPRLDLLQRARTKSFTSFTVGDFGSSKTAGELRPHGAAVQLSYEPQTASDEETLRQLFHVIFNMVTHHYHEMHEHGQIGNEALSWLVAAVEGAVDCAEGEVNRARAKDFTRLKRLCRRPTSRSFLEQVSRDFTKTMETGRTYLHVFEPVIVEYFSIEQCCASQSFFDRFSRSWSLFRRLDYQRMLVKVESLWAFVEAHEVVLRKYSAMERYPDLTKCLRVIVQEAKQDLQLLADIKPRRYWYSKHYLALRVLMTKKRETLAKFAQEGWLARDDCENLNKSLRDRIQEVEYFIPQLYFKQARGAGGHRAERVHSACPPTPKGEQSAAQAMAAAAAAQHHAANRTATPKITPPRMPVVPLAAITPSSTADTIVVPNSHREHLETALGLSSPRNRSKSSHLSFPGYVASPQPCQLPRWDTDGRIAALQGSAQGRNEDGPEGVGPEAEAEAEDDAPAEVVVRVVRPKPARLSTPYLT